MQLPSKAKKRANGLVFFVSWRPQPGSNRLMEVLQTPAFPLRHVALQERREISRKMDLRQGCTVKYKPPGYVSGAEA